MPGKEKRKHRRIPYNASVRYSIGISGPGSEKTVTISEAVRTVDLSKKGLGIFTAFPLKIDQLVTISGRNGVNMPEKAVVIWRARKGIWYRVGLKFV